MKTNQGNIGIVVFGIIIILFFVFGIWIRYNLGQAMGLGDDWWWLLFFK